MDMAETKLMGLPEVARFLSCSERKAWMLARGGALPGLRVGRAWRFRAGDVEAYLRAQQNSPRQVNS